MNRFRPPKIPSRIAVDLKPDRQGYLGRECPNRECRKYFKVTPGTGLPISECTCPYCGTRGNSDRFFTREQIEYGKSVAMRQVEDEVFRSLKSMEFDIKPPRNSLLGLGISMKATRGRTHPIRRYPEKQLETEVVCDQCGLRYAIYGVFGFCPDCGSHNSPLILEKNLDLIRKKLGLADEQEDSELRTSLVENALGDCIAAFDGWGRATVEAFSSRAPDLAKSQKVSFQNISGAAGRLLAQFGVDMRSLVGEADFQMAERLFQKRHVLAHRSGVVDDAYRQSTGDTSVPAGRRIRVSNDEVLGLLAVLAMLARGIFQQLNENLGQGDSEA